MSSLSQIQIAAFTNGLQSPSARFRVRQHVSALAGLGVVMTEFPSRWRGRHGISSVLNAALSLTHRVRDLARARRFNGSLLQRWMLSRFPTLEFAACRPRILDVDDAIWLDSGLPPARWLAGKCAGIICGNTFLAETFAKWNPNIAVIPTAIDTARFHAGPPSEDGGKQIICWSGSASTLPYLYAIENPVAEVLRRCPDAKLRVICNVPPHFTRIRQERYDYFPWSETREVRLLQGCAAGIMPLDDSEWARGKCSFKMLCYMACAIPVVVSPAGMNAEVLQRGPVGFGARNAGEWVTALTEILGDHPAADKMGATGRSVVEQHYSLEALAPRLAAALRRFVNVQ
jgi:glycosyltransferase involved in cell wall biosynthesis